MPIKEDEKKAVKDKLMLDEVETGKIDIDYENTYKKRVAKRGKPSYKQISLLDIPADIKRKLEVEGYVPRWVSPHQYDKRLLQGWEPVLRGGKSYRISTRAEKKDDFPTGTGDVGGSGHSMREMILMKLSLEMAEVIREHNASITSNLLAQKTDEYVNPANRTGGIKVETKKGDIAQEMQDHGK